MVCGRGAEAVSSERMHCRLHSSTERRRSLVSICPKLYFFITEIRSNIILTVICHQAALSLVIVDFQYRTSVISRVKKCNQTTGRPCTRYFIFYVQHYELWKFKCLFDANKYRHCINCVFVCVSLFLKIILSMRGVTLWNLKDQLYNFLFISAKSARRQTFISV